MCIDGIGSHRLIKWYACVPKVMLAANNKAEMVQFKQGYKANRLEMPVHPMLTCFWNVVTC